MTAVVGMALGIREIPKQLVLDSNTAADMFFKSADKVLLYMVFLSGARLGWMGIETSAFTATSYPGSLLGVAYKTLVNILY